MTKRDFFIAMIRLFGLYSACSCLFVWFPHNVQWSVTEYMVGEYYGALWMAVAGLLNIGLFVVLLRKAPWIVTFLGLSKDFDDDRIDLGNVRLSDLLSAGVFVVGGVLIVWSVPVFLSNSLFALKGDMAALEFKTRDNAEWVISGLKSVMGYLLVVYHGQVAIRMTKA